MQLILGEAKVSDSARRSAPRKGFGAIFDLRVWMALQSDKKPTLWSGKPPRFVTRATKYLHSGFAFGVEPNSNFAQKSQTWWARWLGTGRSPGWGACSCWAWWRAVAPHWESWRAEQTHWLPSLPPALPPPAQITSMDLLTLGQ